jgi:pentatricopeptide repeat protein
MFLRQSLRLSARGARIRGCTHSLVRANGGFPSYGTRSRSIYSPEDVIFKVFHRESPSTVYFSTAITDDESPATAKSEIDQKLVEESEHDEIAKNEPLGELTNKNSDDLDSLGGGDQVDFSSKVDEEDAAGDNGVLGVSDANDEDDDLDATTDRLISLLESNSNDSEGPTVNLAKCDAAFEAWAALAANRDGGIDAADTAFQLLEALERNMVRLASGNTFMAWNVAWYNNVMHAYAVCHGGRKAAEKAEEILNKMILACQEYDPTSATLAPPEPTTRSFNIAINAWAKSGEPDSGSHAEQIITRMEQWHLECQEKSQYIGAVANARTMSGVMDAWAQSGVEGAEDRALGILMYAIERQRASVQAIRDGEQPLEGIVVKPNVIMFNSAIHAWVNSKRGQEGAEQAEGILRIMEKLAESGDLGELDESDSDDLGLKPNTRTLSLVIDAWAQCENSEKTGEAAQRAQDILDMMERLYREGHDVKPSFVSFTSCIAAWSRSERHPDAAERAEGLLDRLLNLYKETGDKDFKPTASSGNAVISAFAKSERPDSIERARAVFERMKEFCEPDSYSYNSVINAFAKKGEGLMAKTLLKEMEDACNSGNAAACPDLATYNTVIYALSKSTREGSAQDAEALLNKLKTLYEQGRTDLKPTTETYTTVITAWGRLRHAEKANEILRSAVDSYKAGDESLKPDVKLYTTAINACARSKMKYTAQKRNVLKIAIQLFEELKNTPEYDNPNNVTYRALMKACNELSVDPAERSRLLKAIFQQAAQDGMVSKLVLATLKEGVKPEEFRSIVGENDRMYPRNWSKRVPRRDRP